MDIIIPVNVKLKPILGAGPSRYPTWEQAIPPDYPYGLNYKPFPGFFVYDPADGHNYELTELRAYNTRPSESFSAWKDLGPSPGNLIGYVTNAPFSAYPAWLPTVARIQSFTVGSRCWLPDSAREYESVFDFSQSYDTDLFDTYCDFLFCATVSHDVPIDYCGSISPLNFQSVDCITPNQYQYTESPYVGSVRVRAWIDIGSINPLRALDPRSSLRTSGPSPLTMTVQADGLCDRIAFFGLTDVSTITVGGDVTIPATSLEMGTSGLQRSSIVLTHSEINNPEYELTFTGSSGSGAYPTLKDPAVGAIVAGRALDCGPTETNISGGIVAPRINQGNFGKLSRAQQWYSKRITGTVRPPERTADLVMNALGANVGNPLVIDFSRGQMAESGPLVYGFLEQANQVITGIPNADAIEVTMRGYSQ